MSPSPTRLQILFDQYFSGTLSEAGRLELRDLLAMENDDQQATGMLLEQWNKLEPVEDFGPQQRSALSQRILSAYPPHATDELPDIASTVKPGRISAFIYLAAASVILLFATGISLWIINHRNTQRNNDAAKVITIPSGRDGAILTLADGSTLLLDSLNNGIIANQSGAQLLLKDGRLLYDVSKINEGAPVFNKVTTPTGRQFRLTLPDGTQVWLNAESSIHFPSVFAGDERRVSITGEAYFEVTSNPKMPFKVDVNNKSHIDVLGTNFNINAYENESGITTTLLEGSVRVSCGDTASSALVLRPGEQALVSDHLKARIQLIPNADLNNTMAWKNGLFNFDNASLREVMRQLERWYDIKVVYEKNVPDTELAGEMTRDVSLDGLLIALKELGVHFRLEGRTLFVLP